MNHGSSQQSCKEEYEPWKRGATKETIVQESLVLRKILHISDSYKNHVANEEVCAQIQQAVGPHEDDLTIVKRRKLKWYEHVSLSSGLAKTI